MPASSIRTSGLARQTSSNAFARSHTSMTVDGGRPTSRSSTAPLTWTAPSSERLAEMLFYSLNPNGGGFDSAAAGLDALQGEAVVDELRASDRHRIRQCPPQHLRVGKPRPRARPGTAGGSCKLFPRGNPCGAGFRVVAPHAQHHARGSGVVRISQRRRLLDHLEKVRHATTRRPRCIATSRSARSFFTGNRSRPRRRPHRPGSDTSIIANGVPTSCFSCGKQKPMRLERRHMCSWVRLTTSRTKATGRWRSPGGCVSRCRLRCIMASRAAVA